MPDIKQLTIGSTTYDIKDALTRLEVETSSSSTLTASFGKYYTFSTSSDTFTITLPDVTNVTIGNILFWLSTGSGSSQSITWTPNNNESVYEIADYDLEASSTYEVNALWNGSCWCVTYTKFSIVS